MALQRKTTDDRITVEDYLQGELISEIKHEYLDGHVYPMSGGSQNHERITGNVFGEFRNVLKGRPCEPFASDMKVRVGTNFFYPDVMVVCEEENRHEYYTEAPVIIVEVLSRSTRRMDETTKKLAYQNLSSLKEYVLIEQDFVDVEVCRRSEGWASSHYFMGDEVSFEPFGLILPVEDIYLRVENEDVKTFLEERQQAESANT